LTLEGADYIERCDCFAASEFGISQSVADNVFKEYLEDTSGFLIDPSVDAFDTSAASESADSGHGNALDIVTENLHIMPSLARPPAHGETTVLSFSTARHQGC
jgi:hypothetical protein